jgi:hypothetical protein
VHVTTTKSGSTLSTYVDGSLADSDSPVSGNSINPAGGVAIAKQQIGESWYKGLMDEIRISSSPRSADWAWAEYATMASPSTFATYGTAGVAGAPTVSNGGATGVTVNAAWLTGTLVSTGASATVWGVIWGTNSSATLEGWSGGGTQSFGVATAQNISTSFQATGLSPARTYYYAYWATNAVGTNVALAQSFATLTTPVHSMAIGFGGYSNRTETLTNFPALVVFSNGLGGTFSFAGFPFLSTNGWDLRFKTSGTAAPVGSLNYEIESWNTNGTCYVWVQVPTIATDGTTTIWAWWGNPAESNRLACTTNGATWETSYRGVWHFGEGFGTTFADSTANNHPGTLQGSPLPAWTNMNGNGALLLPGNSGYADFAADAIPGDASGTILYFADSYVTNSLCVDGGGASSDRTMRFGSSIIQAYQYSPSVNEAYKVSSVPGGWHLWAVESSGSAWTA